MVKTEEVRVVRLPLSPRAGLVLGGYSLTAMHAWFAIKLGLPSADGVPELIAGLAAATGMIASIVFFLSAYGVRANAPDEMLDEREVFDRNRAYVTAFKYLAAMSLLGGMVPELVAKLLQFDLSVGVFKNFLLVMFTTSLVLPGFLLAWSER